MREHEAEEIVAMLDGHWTMRMNEETRALWKMALLPLDAAAATQATARLARTEGRPPRISDFEAVYADFAPALPPPTECATCGGDRLVFVGTQRWEGADYEQMAPCPDCNPNADTSFRRADGSRVETMDPALVRERMQRSPRQAPAPPDENRRQADAILAKLSAGTESP